MGFNLKIMSWQNPLTIPWYDITKFYDMGQISKIPWHFFKIPWPGENFVFPRQFPDNSLTRGNPDLLRHVRFCGSVWFSMKQVRTTILLITSQCLTQYCEFFAVNKFLVFTPVIKDIPSPINEFHRFDCEHRSDDVVCVMSSSSDLHQTLTTSTHEDQTSLCTKNTYSINDP